MIGVLRSPGVARVAISCVVAATGCAAPAVSPAPVHAGPPASAFAPAPAHPGTASAAEDAKGREPAAAANDQAATKVPLPAGEEPRPDRALPQLLLANAGLHIGGGKNDAEEKAPFQRAMQRRFPEFASCYRFVEKPLPAATFGADLKIGRAGGHPTVEQPRTILRGDAFAACMRREFESVDFEKPKAGPTTISYSVRFSLETDSRSVQP